jgi:hypothetical protein
VHGGRVDTGRDQRDHVGRISTDDEQPAAQSLVERAQRPVEERPAGRSGRLEQRRVEDEQRE